MALVLVTDTHMVPALSSALGQVLFSLLRASTAVPEENTAARTFGFAWK